tara:strand:+ start:116399 stop:117037 length:639 start_codon:yes stop_codon:yes gene_type:complete
MKLLQIKNIKDKIGVLLVIMHLAGAIGLSNEYSNKFFLSLVPYNLVFTFLLCFYYVSVKKYYKLFILLFLIGYIIELIGVKTGFLFGDYLYGDTLGLKILGVPLVIGLNWLILCLATFSLFSNIFKNKWLQVLFASISMVLLDFIIEPVAIKFSFWSWHDVSVPIQNYIMWFFVSLAMHFILLWFRINIHPKLGIYVILSQLVFFVYLLLII